jgi:hypothetical protein
MCLLPVKRDGSPIELSRAIQKMKPNNVLISAALAAVVAAVTAAGTSYLFLRHAPIGSQSADPERI